MTHGLPRTQVRDPYSKTIPLFHAIDPLRLDCGFVRGPNTIPGAHPPPSSPMRGFSAGELPASWVLDKFRFDRTALGISKLPVSRVLNDLAPRPSTVQPMFLVRCWLNAAGCWLLVERCWLLVAVLVSPVFCPLSAVRCLLSAGVSCTLTFPCRLTPHLTATTAPKCPCLLSHLLTPCPIHPLSEPPCWASWRLVHWKADGRQVARRTLTKIWLPGLSTLFDSLGCTRMSQSVRTVDLRSVARPSHTSQLIPSS